MSTEAPGQVLCGASSHPPGADKVHSPAHVLWKQLVDFSSWCPICLFVNTRDFFNVFPFFLDQNLYSSWPAYYSNISCTCPAVRSIIWSLCFQCPRMPCGNLLVEPIRGYYRSFWWSTTEEMWSGSSDFFFFLCDSPPETLRQDLCHWPHSTPNNFCFATISVWTKGQAPVSDPCRCNSRTGFVAACFLSFCIHEQKSTLWLTLAFFYICS